MIFKHAIQQLLRLLRMCHALHFNLQSPNTQQSLLVHANISLFLERQAIEKMLGPFATASRLTPIHQVLLAVLSRAACASMSTTTTTTTRDRGDRYGPMEWAQQPRRHITIQQQAEVVFWSNMIHYLHLVWPETHFQLSTQNVSYLQHTTIKSIIALMGTDQVY